MGNKLNNYGVKINTGFLNLNAYSQACISIYNNKKKALFNKMGKIKPNRCNIYTLSLLTGYL